MPSSRCSSLMSARICAWIVTSSAVVGSSAIRSCGRQASAIAIITRWRMPPERLCGKSFARDAAAGMRTRSSIRTASASAAAPSFSPWIDQHFGDLGADRRERVEARHRLLEHHADLAAAHLAHLRLGQRQELAARRGGPSPRSGSLPARAGA